MANFIVRTITPGPLIDVTVSSPDNGAPLRSTTYRGMIEVSVDTSKGPTLTAGTLPVVLPDSLRYSLAETTGGWAACTVVPVGQTPIVADVRIAIDGTSASFGADPAEPDDLRLHLAVQTRTTNLLESYVVLLSYEATVVVPISVR